MRHLNVCWSLVLGTCHAFICIFRTEASWCIFVLCQNSMYHMYSYEPCGYMIHANSAPAGALCDCLLEDRITARQVGLGQGRLPGRAGCIAWPFDARAGPGDMWVHGASADFKYEFPASSEKGSCVEVAGCWNVSIVFCQCLLLTVWLAKERCGFWWAHST